MRRRLRLLEACLLLAVVAFSAGATDPAARFNDLGHRMMCTCGCNQVLLECNHVGCTVSGGMRDELTNAITRGDSDSLILQSFVQKYGAVVMAAPLTTGYNLVAWIMPFAVLAAALAGAVALIRRWRSRRPSLAASAVLPANHPLEQRIRRDTEEWL